METGGWHHPLGQPGEHVDPDDDDDDGVDDDDDEPGALDPDPDDDYDDGHNPYGHDGPDFQNCA